MQPVTVSSKDTGGRRDMVNSLPTVKRLVMVKSNRTEATVSSSRTMMHTPYPQMDKLTPTRCSHSSKQELQVT